MGSVRTCVGCRVRAERSSLLRVAAQGSHLVADRSATLPGRGAWLHPSIECYQDAVRRRAFARALRITTPLDMTPLETALMKEQAERLMDKK